MRTSPPCILVPHVNGTDFFRWVGLWFLYHCTWYWSGISLLRNVTSCHCWWDDIQWLPRSGGYHFEFCEKASSGFFFFFLSLSWFSFHIQWNAHVLSYFNLFNRENCLARKECEGKRMVWDLVKFFCDKRMCWNVVYIVVQNVILIDFPHILFVIFWNGIQLSIKQICMNSRQLQNHSVSVLTLHVSRSTCYTYVLL